MNKYRGINDYLNCDKRVYRLWYDMHRRCYDETQHCRAKGASYVDCTVCDRWHSLKAFSHDIQFLNGYDDWCNGGNMVLDKDSLVQGNREYAPDTCCFLTKADSQREMLNRNPGITENANESHKSVYKIEMVFSSEKEAAAFLGVRKCSVASCYRRKRKCKGFTITRLGTKMDANQANGYTHD